jgi:hypothetical protein
MKLHRGYLHENNASITETQLRDTNFLENGHTNFDLVSFVYRYNA